MEKQCVKVYVLNPYTPQSDFSCEMSLASTLLDLKRHLLKAYPENPALADQRIIIAGKIFSNDTTFETICTKLENKKEVNCHLILPLKYKPQQVHNETNTLQASFLSDNKKGEVYTTPEISVEPFSTNLSRLTYAAEASDLFTLSNSLPAVISQETTPRFTLQSINEVTREAEEIQALLDFSNNSDRRFSNHQGSDSITAKAKLDNNSRVLNESNKPTGNATEGKHDPVQLLKEALAEYETAHAKLVNTIVLSQRLQRLTEKVNSSPQLLIPSKHQTAPRGQASRLQGDASELLANRRVTIRPESIRFNFQPPTPIRPTLPPQLPATSELERNRVGGNVNLPQQLNHNNINNNNNNIRILQRNEQVINNVNNIPVVRQRRLNFEAINFSLILRLLFMIYLISGDSLDFEDPSFVYTIIIAVAYYLYEVGAFNYLFGVDLSFNRFSGLLSESRVAMIEAVSVYPGAQYDVLVFVKAFVFSLLPSWRANEFPVIVDSNRQGETGIREVPQPAEPGAHID